jgi:hypothetical protein
VKELIKLVGYVVGYSGHAGLVLASISVLAAALIALLLRSAIGMFKAAGAILWQHDLQF